jgi:hypothetical protein
VKVLAKKSVRSDCIDIAAAFLQQTTRLPDALQSAMTDREIELADKASGLERE